MQVQTFDNHDINDGTNYIAGLVGAVRGLPPARAGRVARASRWPLLTGVERAGWTVAVEIALRGEATNTLQDQLSRWFDPEAETPAALVVTDDDGSSNERYLMCLCEDLQEEADRAGRVFRAKLAVAGDVRWRATTATEEEWLVTATGDTETIDNEGSDEAYLILRIKPTAAKTGGYTYRRQIFVRWRVSEAAAGYSIDLTDNSLDTTTLVADSTRSVQVNVGGGINNSVTTIPYDTETGTFPSSGLAYVGTEQISYTGKSGGNLTGVTRGVNGTSAASHADNAVIYASKMQADGDDLRVLVNGVEVDRWSDDFLDATTKVWAILDFQPKVELTITAAIAGSGSVDTIDFNEDITNLPAAGMVMIGSECFVFTGKNNALKRITGVTRASKGTSMGSHSAAATAWWVQHDVVLLYGNQSAATPTTDDDYMPIFSLSGSNNGSWDYTEFGSVNEAGVARPGSWYRQARPRDARLYTANQVTDADPWSEVGIELGNFALFRDLARWAVANPCGITDAFFQSGEKYVFRDADEFSAAIQSYGGVESLETGDFVTEYDIAAPALDTWESWSQNQALDSGSTAVGLMLAVPDDGGAVDTRRVEASRVTLTLNSSNTPAITIGSEEGNYSLACTITNNTTDESIQLNFVMDIDQELEVNTDEKTVTYNKDGSSQFQALTVTGGARRNWLPLIPGENELQFDDTGTAGVTVTVLFRKRYYN
jgi:hypothetical protein